MHTRDRPTDRERARAAVRRPGVASAPPTRPAGRSIGRRKRRNWRKTAFRLHGWIGLNLSLLLFVICFSGSVATLSHEIDWLLDARQRVPAREAPYDWTAMHETVARAFPDGQNLGVRVAGSSGVRPAGSWVAAVAYVALPHGQTRKVYLDPYTGALQGHTSFFNTQRFFRTFHRRLFDGTRGIVIVTLASLVLLTAALSGFAFYKGWLKQLFTLRLSRSRRLRWSDLHKTAGIWGLVFTLLIGLTGVFYLVEVGFQAAGRHDMLWPPPLPQVAETELLALGPQPELLPTAAYVRAAEAAYPALTVRSVRMPNAPGAAVYVDGEAGNPLTRDRADKVHLHPFTAEVLGVQKTSDLGLVPWITDAVDPLHFGYFGGLWTKALWCVLGLMLSFSILSGTYLWVVRSGTGRRAPSWWLRGAPLSAAVTLAYFTVVAFATVRGIQAYAPTDGPPVPIAHVELGPYEVRLDCTAPCETDAGATIAARFLGDGLPNYAQAELVRPDGGSETLHGPAWRPVAAIEADPATPLTLRVTMRNGQRYEASFAPAPVPTPYSRSTPWPDTASGVWWVVGSFVAVTGGLLSAWLAFVFRALGEAAVAPTRA